MIKPTVFGSNRTKQRQIENDAAKIFQVYSIFVSGVFHAGVIKQ